ncbi:histidinol-phosphate transaminase [Ramlibacter solisilvae]|uniref:Histidinol-phosphate aminotransferase n=1 Tax=Ramlibacter tataouinensis TaxID=94132 RepID=A0A127JT42_9BURK|nr:histidinol-phosphate transaminase [Ramlibacter tataouinensis]AMO23043.1 histidinol-phosphate aminotransferase [Ramlibacter tataouinensis]
MENRYWSEALRGIQPYVPGEQPATPGLVKLNTNENPFPPSPAALEAIRQAANADLRLYPDPDSRRLKDAFARINGIAPECVFAGNSSDEVLAHAFLGLLRHARPILFPDISYSFYPVYCRLYGIACETVPLDGDFRIRVSDYARPNGGVVLANPNAPTGRALGLDDVRALLQANRDSVVLIDEAYVDFGAQSAIALIGEFPNLLVTQTLSKSRSLAGLRVGFAAGQPGLVQALEAVKGSFNSYPLDRLAIAGGTAALLDQEHFERTRRQVMDNREWLAAELARLGFAVLPSLANFLFVRHPAHGGGALLRALRERKILVRHFNAPRIEQYLRITVGTREQCVQLVDALRDLLAIEQQPSC